MRERGIVEWLKNPQTRIGIDEILKHWAAQEIIVAISRPANHASPIELLGRIRRAWGTRLKRSASPEGFAGKPCPWDPPCARDIFFHEQFRFSANHGLPKPYVFSMDVERSHLVVRLALFGAGIDYSYAAREALVEALRFGVSWNKAEAPVDHTQESSEIRSCEIRPLIPADISDDCQRLRISFITPLKLGGEDPANNPSTIIARMARRTGNMLHWMGCGLDANWSEISRLWKQLDYSILEDAPAVIHHNSRRQNARYDVDGVQMTFDIDGALAPLIPIIAASQTCNIGGNATAGFGRFMIQL